MKKILAILLVLTLLLATAACGKSDTAPTTKPGGEDATVGTTEAVVDSENGNGVLAEVTVITYDDSGTSTKTTQLSYEDGYNLVSTEITLNGELSSKETYDLRLDETVFMAFYRDGQMQTEYRYQYDDQGRLLSGSVTDTEKTEHVHTYDQYGNTLSSRRYVDGELEYERTYENSYDGQTLTKTVQYENGEICNVTSYDGSGRMTENISYGDGVPKYRVTYKYDERGNVLEDAEYSGDTKIHNSSYTYDDQGNKIEYIHYCGPLESRETYEYQDGKLVTSVYYSEGEEFSRTCYEYDAAGRITKQSVISNGSEYSRVTFLYEGDRLVEKRVYRDSELNIVTTYEYDRYGNLLRHEQQDSGGNVMEVGTYGYDAVASLPENPQALEQYLSQFLPFEEIEE